jgi:hypothetical protein
VTPSTSTDNRSAESSPSTSTGPANASTAIGGVAPHPGTSGGSTDGSTPAPTAGDGAASAASR